MPKLEWSPVNNPVPMNKLFEMLTFRHETKWKHLRILLKDKIFSLLVNLKIVVISEL